MELLRWLSIIHSYGTKQQHPHLMWPDGLSPGQTRKWELTRAWLSTSSVTFWLPPLVSAIKPAKHEIKFNFMLCTSPTLRVHHKNLCIARRENWAESWARGRSYRQKSHVAYVGGGGKERRKTDRMTVKMNILRITKIPPCLWKLFSQQSLLL